MTIGSSWRILCVNVLVRRIKLPLNSLSSLFCSSWWRQRRKLLSNLRYHMLIIGFLFSFRLKFSRRPFSSCWFSLRATATESNRDLLHVKDKLDICYLDHSLPAIFSSSTNTHTHEEHKRKGTHEQRVACYHCYPHDESLWSLFLKSRFSSLSLPLRFAPLFVL